MLSPLVQERITTPKDVFYCDCKAECADKFKLPTLAVEMLMSDTSLMLLIGKHTSARAGKVAAKGKGWKICKVVT